MDAVVVGTLTALTLSAVAALWYALVRPEVLLALLDDGAADEGRWFGTGGSALVALRYALCALLFVLAFATGAATAFLGATARGL